MRLRLCFLVIALLSARARDMVAQQAAAGQPTYGGTLVIAGAADLQGLNSLTATDSYTQEFLQYVLFLPLIRFTPSLTYAPALARSWRMMGDTGVVFDLRRDVRWHDGRRTTAHDVAFTYRRAQDPKTGFANGEYFARWTGVRVVDSFTVQFSFTPHLDPLMGLAFTAIMPRHLLDSIPSERLAQAAFNRKPVGNGPFRFVSYSANDRWIFEANRLFPAELGGRPYVDRLVWRVIPENMSQVAEIQTGNVDLITSARAQQAQELARVPGLRALAKPSRKYLFIGWNGKRQPLDNPRVRKALTMALDRDRMIEVLRAGYAEKAIGPISPFHWAFDRTLEPLPYHVAGARALLASEGFRDRNGDGVLEDADGKRFEIELKIMAANSFNRDAAEMIRSDLAAVGVKLAARPLDFPTLIGDISVPERRFDAVLMNWESDFRINLRDSFHSENIAGPYQSASYRNSRVDTLLDRVSGLNNRQEAAVLWKEVQQILIEEQPWTFLWYTPDLLVVRRRVQNMETDARGLMVNVARWWLAGERS